MWGANKSGISRNLEYLLAKIGFDDDDDDDDDDESLPVIVSMWPCTY